MTRTPDKHSGFTIIEIMIVVIVIAILASIGTASYIAVQNRAKTTAGQAYASQVAEKAKTFKKFRASFPTVAQLKANPPVVPESRLDDASTVISPTLTTQKSKATYSDGENIAYRYVNTEVACVFYWDYQENTHKVILLGNTHSDCT